MAVEELGARPFVIPRRVAPPRNDGLAVRFARGLARALARDRPAPWEWTVAAVGLFLLARTPVLFLRRRLGSVFGGSTSELWQDDVVVTFVFAAVHVGVIAIAARRSELDALLRQKLLLAFCATAWLSTTWSVEPGLTARRAALFVGTAGVGWYLGTRFSLRQQPAIPAAAAGIGAVASIIVVSFWPDLGFRGAGEILTGVYVNRNMLGLAMSLGLLGAAFLAMGSRRGRAMYIGAAFGFGLLLVLCGTRTGPVGLIITLAMCVLVWGSRRILSHRITATSGALIMSAAAVSVASLLAWHSATIAGWLGRDVTLSNRTRIWELAQWLADKHPWQGWGLEAIWSDRTAVGTVQSAFGLTAAAGPEGGSLGVWPYAAHNGYLEIRLGMGQVGLLLLTAFLAVSLWRSFRYAWSRDDMISLWPFALLVFAIVVNLSESLFIANEATWALVVAAAVCVTQTSRKEGV